MANFRSFSQILGQKIFSCKTGSITHNFIWVYGLLALCQNSEKTNDTIPRKSLDRRTDGRTEGQTDPILEDLSATPRGPITHYPLAVKFDKCVGICNTLNDLSNRVCVPNKTKDLKIHVFNRITRKNESKILTKDI